MRDFYNLKVWVKSHQLVLALYKASVCFPQTEIYGLTSQLVSVAKPISSPEGAGQNSPGRKPWARIKDPKSPEAKQKVNDKNELRRPYRAYPTFYHFFIKN
jgi:hypothetical protein